jgi:uncharacterized membrane protein YgaE (UPF0421/DUF939 family)
MSELFGLPFLPGYDLAHPGGVVALLLTILAVGFFIHLAARSLIKKDDVHRALVASTLGILLAQLAFTLVGSDYWIVGLLLAVLAFMLSIGAVYRAKAQAAVSVGAVTWVLWILAGLALAYAQAHWHP